MTLAVLIQGTPKVEAVRTATAISATAATEGGDKAGTVARVATVAVAATTIEKPEPPPDPAAEARRQNVLAMLHEDPTCHYAFITDLESDPEVAIIALAIRGKATCELHIPRSKYDSFLLLGLIERYGATVH